MEAEGREAVFARHEACATAARTGLADAGLTLVADPAHASRTVTAAWLPDGTDPKAFSAALRARDVVVAGGQGRLKGKIVRIGHLGWVTVDDVEAAVAAVADVVQRGIGTSVAAGA
jgi:aspartate aminotransferase-like enzyme